VASTDLGTPEHTRKTILQLLDARSPGKTICPSDAARVLAGDGDFRPYMGPVREAAARLVDAGRIEVTQKGEPVTIANAHGPIRLGLTDDPDDER
jgi:hypothetical protein